MLLIIVNYRGDARGCVLFALFLVKFNGSASYQRCNGGRIIGAFCISLDDPSSLRFFFLFSPASRRFRPASCYTAESIRATYARLIYSRSIFPLLQVSRTKKKHHPYDFYHEVRFSGEARERAETSSKTFQARRQEKYTNRVDK